MIEKSVALFEKGVRGGTSGGMKEKKRLNYSILIITLMISIDI
jgi:hypothetical protein